MPMTIRRKLLLFIPLLVLLVNSVTFFLFQSGKIVQQSYNLMMDRILLYKQAAQLADDNLRALYGYLLNPAEGGETEVRQSVSKLQELRAALAGNAGTTHFPSELRSYNHMLVTLTEQELNALGAAVHAPATAFAHYEDAEKTTAFIREDGQRLVDLELSFYQPVFRQIQDENRRMNRLGAAVFVVNTLLSVVVAVWISRSVTGPVGRLVVMARQIAKGKLDIDPPALGSGDELGILSDAFRHMLTDLKELIAKDKESLEKDKLVKELELQALQSQINPHFLFNTLNALSKLALIEGAEKTSDLIVSMSGLMRYNLRRLDQPVTLRDELEHVKRYFTIQQARFRDRVRFELDVDENALQVLLPALTLQPLVENAFVHGIEGMEHDARIRLEIRSEPEGVRVSVSDNGKGMSEEARQALLRLEPDTAVEKKSGKHSTGLGTRNVFKRLHLFYGRGDFVNIESKPGEGTTVTIRIPHGKEGERNDISAVDRR